MILVALVVLVAGGVGAWYYYNQQQLALVTPTPVPTAAVGLPTSSPTTSAAATAFSGRLADLIRQGQNLTCTFQRADDSSSVNGTLYVSGQNQKLRGDFTVQQVSAGAMASHMIRDGLTMYVWADNLPQGTKFTVADQAAVSVSPQPSASPGQSSQITDQSFQYACQPWTASEAVFALPTNVQFIDITQQLPQFQGSTAPAAATAVPTSSTTKAQQCAVCNNLSGAGKAQCLAAYGC